MLLLPTNLLLHKINLIMIEISDGLYRLLAQRLMEQLSQTTYFNGSIEVDTDELYTTLRATLIVYRRAYEEPTGMIEKITDIVPVWWEYVTTDVHGEQTNDFSWCEFIEHMDICR